MSDQTPQWGPPQQPPSGPQAWPPPASPPPGPPGAPALAGAGPAAFPDAGTVIQTEHVTTGNGGGVGGRIAIIAAVLGAAALLAGAGWFAIRALTASDGADSPEAATDALVEAINDEDFLTMAELLEPGERRAIAEPILFEIVPELQRLGVLTDSFATSGTQGLDLELADVTYRVERPADSPDVAFVYFTGGTSTTSFDLDEFQFGSRVRDEIEQDLDGLDERQTTEITDLASDTPVVMVERDGRWYVSMVYSAMESALPGELPAQVTGLTPVGADSPEDAVEAMLQSMVDLDLQGMIERLEPGEMHALHRYSPLFLDEAQEALDEVRQAIDDEGVRITLADLDLERVDVDRHTLVDIRGFTLDLEGPNLGTARFEYGRERIALNYSSDTGADRIDVEVTPRSLTVDGTIEGEAVDIDVTANDAGTEWVLDGRVAQDTVTGSLTIDDDCWPYEVVADGETLDGCLIDDLGTVPFDPDDLPTEFGGVPMVVAENDGQWYVSPIGTVMYGVVEGLRGLDESDIDQWFEEGTVLSGFDPFSLGGLGGLGVGGASGLDEGLGGSTSAVTSLEAPLLVGVGETVVEEQTLGSNENHRWTVVLADGEALAATLDGGGPGDIPDPLLEVYDDLGVLIGTNDDYDGLNSGLRLEGPGTFVLAAQDLGGNDGSYRLTVEVAAGLDALVVAPDAVVIGAPITDAAPVESQVEDLVFVDLSSGSFTAAGSVGDNLVDQFVVEGAGSTVTIELVPAAGSDFDPFLVALDEVGTVLDTNDDDSSGELPPLSSRIVLEAPPGVFTIEARSFFNRAGDYEILISTN